MLHLLATTLSVSVVILLFYAVKYIIKILKQQLVKNLKTIPIKRHHHYLSAVSTLVLKEFTADDFQNSSQIIVKFKRMCALKTK
ncbi:hypothetical protein F6Y02_43595 [Bacillus megaterium]|nr:hypothetical protein [Priestia megaterium]